MNAERHHPVSVSDIGFETATAIAAACGGGFRYQDNYRRSAMATLARLFKVTPKQTAWQTQLVTHRYEHGVKMSDMANLARSCQRLDEMSRSEVQISQHWKCKGHYNDITLFRGEEP